MDMGSMSSGMSGGMSGMSGGMSGMAMPPELMAMVNGMIMMIDEHALFIYDEMYTVMIMYGACCILPIVGLQKYMFTKMTRQPFTITPFFIMSQLLFLSYVWTITKFSVLRTQTNSGFGMPMAPPEVQFIAALMNDMNEELANVPFLISLICGFAWLRTLAAMTNT